MATVRPDSHGQREVAMQGLADPRAETPGTPVSAALREILGRIPDSAEVPLASTTTALTDPSAQAPVSSFGSKA